MTFSTFWTFFCSAIPAVPWQHWVVMGLIAVAIASWGAVEKEFSAYASIVLGLAVMMGLYLLEVAVFVRLDTPEPLVGFDLVDEYQRLVQPTEEFKFLLFSNVAGFVPFGLLESEFLSSTKKAKSWYNVRRTAICGALLSLSMEILQFVLKVGITELTDLLLNTLGTAIGAGVALAVRAVVKRIAK